MVMGLAHGKADRIQNYARTTMPIVDLNFRYTKYSMLTLLVAITQSTLVVLRKPTARPCRLGDVRLSSSCHIIPFPLDATE